MNQSLKYPKRQKMVDWFGNVSSRVDDKMPKDINPQTLMQEWIDANDMRTGINLVAYDFDTGAFLLDISTARMAMHSIEVCMDDKSKDITEETKTKYIMQNIFLLQKFLNEFMPLHFREKANVSEVKN